MNINTSSNDTRALVTGVSIQESRVYQFRSEFWGRTPQPCPIVTEVYTFL